VCSSDLFKIAQDINYHAPDLIVVDPEYHHEHAMELVPIEIHEVPNQEDISVEEPEEIEIVISDIAGAPPGTKDPEPIIEISEEDKEEANDSLISKCNKFYCKLKIILFVI
jgi:hypothetical protein